MPFFLLNNMYHQKLYAKNKNSFYYKKWDFYIFNLNTNIHACMFLDFFKILIYKIP